MQTHFARQPLASLSALLLLLAILLIQPGCRRPHALVRETWPTMGTWGSLTLPEADAARLTEATAACQAVCNAIETSMSTYRPDSEISILNRQAGTRAMEMTPMSLDVLRAARRYGDLSRGCFDVTVGPLIRLWGLSTLVDPEDIPTPEQIQTARGLVGYSHLMISNNTAMLEKPGMSVDLGGIAKGYAVDVCFARLQELGVSNAMVNLGGNIRCAGLPDGHSPWTIGVRNPFAAPTESGTPIIGRILLTNGMAVATSGHYERFVTIQGRRYAHIIDPRVGAPVQGMAGVTVVAANAMHCDGMSTSLFILGIEDSRPVLAGMPGTEAILIPDTPENPVVWITPGLQSRFTAMNEWKNRIRVLDPPALAP